MRLMMLAALAVAIAGPAAAQTPPEGIVWIALRDINDYYDDPGDPTNRPALVREPPAGMIVAVEVSDDGRPDWLIDYEHDGTGAFCGTGGCLKRLYVSHGDGYVRAFDRQALEVSVSRAGVEARVHHQYCRPGQAECRYAWAWDAGLRRLVERPASDGLTRLEGGGLRPVDRPGQGDPDALPAELAQVWYGGRLTCRDYSDAGFATLRPEFVDVPDVDGDGRRDWIEISPVCAADDVGTPQFAVWVTAGDDALEVAYRSQTDRYPSVDIGATPATVVVNPACGYGEPCPDERLRWSAGEGRLVPTR